MAEIIRYEINKPKRITLRNAAGREKEGDYGVQYFHALLPDGITYLEPVVERLLQEMRIADGETVEITRPSRGKQWIVRRPEIAPPAAAVTAPQNVQTQQNVVTSPQPNMRPGMPNPASKLMTGALIAAVDATLLAQQYAAAKGMTVLFSAEDLRCLASTLLIQYWRNGAIPAAAEQQQPGMPGGAAWQQ